MLNGANSGGAFEQFVASGGEEAALRDGAAPVAGAPHALQRDGDRARRSDLANKVDGADVDAELQRSRGDQQRGFRRSSACARRPGVTSARGCRDGTPPGLRPAAPPGDGEALGQTTRIDEDQRRAMLQRQRGDAVVDLVPHFVAGDGPIRMAGTSTARSSCAGGQFDDGRIRPSRCRSESARPFIGFCVAERPMRVVGVMRQRSGARARSPGARRACRRRRRESRRR